MRCGRTSAPGPDSFKTSVASIGRSDGGSASLARNVAGRLLAHACTDTSSGGAPGISTDASIRSISGRRLPSGRERDVDLEIAALLGELERVAPAAHRRQHGLDPLADGGAAVGAADPGSPESPSSARRRSPFRSRDRRAPDPSASAAPLPARRRLSARSSRIPRAGSPALPSRSRSAGRASSRAPCSRRARRNGSSRPDRSTES